MNDSNEIRLDTLRHSSAHVMAAAVTRLFNPVRLDIGPATEDGFYYDLDLPHRLGPEDFGRIEEAMRELIRQDLPFERVETDRAEAQRLFEAAGQIYKLDRLAAIPEGEPITLYRCGDFVDLCQGPHLASTGQIPAFRLLSVAGSYFHGLETNPMLQRLYGTAFPTAAELDAHLARLEEAKLRDHRRIGRELDLFSIEEDVGPGLVHWHPKGSRIRHQIEEFWRREHFRNGYELLYSPHIGRSGLWETSGHLDFYRDGMYAPMQIDENEYFIKPMNCPFHIQVYRSRPRSYRELPLRWAELGTVYRYEKTGVLHGLLRVRGFTQDDAHIFCTPEQIESEIREVIRFAVNIWRAFGFDQIRAYLSTRPEKAVGDADRWDQATRSLVSALNAEAIPYETDEGGGAFYGPKIDLKIRDAIGREWQMSTVQFDFNLPDRFDLGYIGADGQTHRPYMVHRALLGSLERFFGILVEHYAGAFPLWLAPEQVRILPLTDRQIAFARGIRDRLRDAEIRVALDESPDKLGAKIRRAQVEKIPYMLVVGPKEEAAGTVALRARAGGDLGALPLEAVLERFHEEIINRGPRPETKP
jgi:threonyl-tRNA synthetase